MGEENYANPLTNDQSVCYGVGVGYLCAQKQELWQELRLDIRLILCAHWGLDQYGSSEDLEETIDEILDAVLTSEIFR